MFGHDFPYLDTRDINLDWLLKNMKTVVQQWTEYQLSMNTQFSNLSQAFDALKDWIENYFENLDVSAEIEQKLDRMAVSGELGFIMRPIISGEVSDWLAEHITQPTTPAIDTSLTVRGAAADAQATGYALHDNVGIQSRNISVTSSNVSSYPDADTFPNRSIINVLASASVAHKPYDSCTIFTTGFATTDTAPYGGSKQIAINNLNGAIAVRSNNGTSWSNWLDFLAYTNDKIDDNVAVKSESILVDSSNASTYPDVDTFPNRTIINVLGSASILHKPFSSCTIITTGYNTTDTAPYGGSKQIALNNLDGSLAMRSHTGSAWSSWLVLNDYIDTVVSASAGFTCQNILVSAANSASYPDVDTFPNRSIIDVLASATSAHKPFESFTVITTGFNKTNTAPYGGSKQLAMSNLTGILAVRSYDGTKWSDWHYQTSIIYADSSNFIEKIADGIITANSIIYLSPGTYNLFDTTHDETYWKNARPATRYCGIILRNGIELIGTGKVVFNAVYTGSDEDIKENFSVFNIAGDAKISNVDIIGENICYLVHDDSPIVGGASNSFTITGCKLIHNGSDHTFTSGAPMCIGAGEADNTFREYSNCIFDSTYERSVNVHTKSGGTGRYIITGNYFIDGTLGFTQYGDGTGVLDAVVSNNCVPAAIIDRTDGDATLYAFNNVVRT